MERVPLLTALLDLSRWLRCVVQTVNQFSRASSVPPSVVHATWKRICVSQEMERALLLTAPLDLSQWLQCVVQTANRYSRVSSVLPSVAHATWKRLSVNQETERAQLLVEIVFWETFLLLRNALQLVMPSTRMLLLHNGELERARKQCITVQREMATALFLTTVNWDYHLLLITAFKIAVM